MVSARSKNRSPTQLAAQLADLMTVKHGYDVLIMDLRPLTSMTDYFVLCSCDSDVQVKAVVDHLDDALRQEGVRPLHIEGIEQRLWVILDYVNVVAHVFMRSTREYYGLERLWADAEMATVDNYTAS